MHNEYLTDAENAEIENRLNMTAEQELDAMEKFDADTEAFLAELDAEEANPVEEPEAAIS